MRKQSTAENQDDAFQMQEKKHPAATNNKVAVGFPKVMTLYHE